MSNITRSESIKTLKEHLSHWERLLREHICDEQEGIDTISALKLAIASLETDEAYQLEYERTTKNDLGVDAISRKAVQTRLKEIINEMETIFADIREREVNDSVCGLCEYDCDHGLDGFANECPGFEKDDCFKLNEKYRAEWLDISNLPSVTPQPRKGHWTEEFNDLEGEVRFTCSSCGNYQLFGTDFCYHCGSDNREVVEE